MIILSNIVAVFLLSGIAHIILISKWAVIIGGVLLTAVPVAMIKPGGAREIT
jgi:hypothetical protein